MHSKPATRRFGTKVSRRTNKLVATTLAEIPGEEIPLLGIPILLAAPAYEIKLACENLDDLYQLYADMGMGDETPDDVMHSSVAVMNAILPMMLFPRNGQ